LTAEHLARVIDPLMNDWVEQRKGPGAVVVVVRHDGLVFAKGYGSQDIAANKPFTADQTLVRPGSISKLFTGIAVMQLVDAGKLDLDRDVNDYLDFTIPTPVGGVPVTLRRLMTHRAGFEEHVKGLFARSPEPAPLGPWLKENLPLRLFPKGDVAAYSNYGFALVGYIVERVSGEPFASYVKAHILDPLGMSHSTFQQPLPADLAPLMAKAYIASDAPERTAFETVLAPAGALSATGTDMARFLRALLNGGELDGVRILARSRLDEMMAPQDATPAGYLGLVFFGKKIRGHDALGHDGATQGFFSELEIFPGQDLGIFVCRDGIGEIKSIGDLARQPAPLNAIVRRFLPEVPEPTAKPSTAADTSIAGAYRSGRRADSTFLRFNDLLNERLVRIDAAGDMRLHLAIWPFSQGTRFRHIDHDLYEGPGSSLLAFVNDGAGSAMVQPGGRLQRAPWWLDVRWIGPAFLTSAIIILTTLLGWPTAALYRRWRERHWSQDRTERRQYLAIRMILLADAIEIIAMVVLLIMSGNLTIFNAELDPWLLALYALAWLGVLGAAPMLWIAIQFWRGHVGGRWSRIHHSLIAASGVFLAWFFVVFRIAGTTLNY
jgi:CubicO group peptidase (beta-lactamase class C family)